MLTFIVVAVVIAALLVGGVFWLRQRGEDARRDSDVAVSRDEGAPQQGGEAKKEESTNSAPAPQPERTQDDAGVTQPAHLPETGPAEVLMSSIAVSVLAYFAVRFIASRNELVRATSL